MVQLTENVTLMSMLRQIAVETGELCVCLDFSVVTESLWLSLKTGFCSKKGIAEGLKQGRRSMTNVQTSGIFPLLPKVSTARQGVVASGLDFLVMDYSKHS